MGVQSTLFLLNTTTTFIHSPPQSEYLWGNPDYISTDNLTRKQRDTLYTGVAYRRNELG